MAAYGCLEYISQDWSSYYLSARIVDIPEHACKAKATERSNILDCEASANDQSRRTRSYSKVRSLLFITYLLHNSAPPEGIGATDCRIIQGLFV